MNTLFLKLIDAPFTLVLFLSPLLGSSLALADGPNSCDASTQQEYFQIKARNDAEDAQYKFYFESAQKTFATLQNAAQDISPSNPDLAALIAHRDSDKFMHADQEKRLTAGFQNNLIQMGTGANLSGSVYTFCPAPSKAVAGKTLSPDIAPWSTCQDGNKNPEPIRVDQIWISNYTQPLLTLRLSSAGFQSNINIDLLKLLHGTYTFEEFFKEFWPFKRRAVLHTPGDVESQLRAALKKGPCADYPFDYVKIFNNRLDHAKTIPTQFIDENRFDTTTPPTGAQPAVTP